MNILKLVLGNLRHKPVTLRFPTKVTPPPNFRGLVKIDTRKCIGCGICAYVCPDKAIELSDSRNYYEWTYDPGCCTFCEHCYTYCPVSALSMEPESALAYNRRYELKQIHKMDYPVCPECGRTALPVSEKLLVLAFGQIADEMRGWIHLCERCRRRRYQRILKINVQGENQSHGS